MNVIVQFPEDLGALTVPIVLAPSGQVRAKFTHNLFPARAQSSGGAVHRGYRPPAAISRLQTVAEESTQRRRSSRRIYVERYEPLLLMHGFPSSSFDWRHVIDALAGERRVVTFDFPGFGLSDKPSGVRYSLFDQADVAEAVVRSLGIERAAVVSHDMGDSIAAELYARSTEGTLPFEITRRIAKSDGYSGSRGCAGIVRREGS